jgi:hypothetical protein
MKKSSSMGLNLQLATSELHRPDYIYFVAVRVDDVHGAGDAGIKRMQRAQDLYRALEIGYGDAH